VTTDSTTKKKETSMAPREVTDDHDNIATVASRLAVLDTIVSERQKLMDLRFVTLTAGVEQLRIGQLRQTRMLMTILVAVIGAAVSIAVALI